MLWWGVLGRELSHRAGILPKKKKEGVFALGTKSLQKASEESMGLSLAVPQGSSSASSRERNCLISQRR